MMIQRILPLLNRLLPKNLAMKGLTKLDPRLGNFFTGAAAAGYSIDSALDFLRDEYEGSDENLRPDERAAERRVKQSKTIPNLMKAAGQAGLGLAAAEAIPGVIGNLFQEKQEPNPEQEQQAPASPQQEALQNNIKKAKQRQEASPLGKESLINQFEGQEGNVITQYSPELSSFIEQQVQSGRSPIEAGALAQLDKESFGKVISKMERELKMPWSQILAEVYGRQQQQQQPQQGQQPQQQGQGQGKAALLQSMQQITQALQQMRGNK